MEDRKHRVAEPSEVIFAFAFIMKYSEKMRRRQNNNMKVPRLIRLQNIVAQLNNVFH